MTFGINSRRKLFMGGNYTRVETNQGGTLIKWGNYSRGDTID
jgi:hypothetical protein